MKQKIKAMLEEKRGVSPVIGVILMVAITVILAAVIGTFVLGLGDSLNQAPQAQLDASFDSGSSTVTISHNGGDPIPLGDVRVDIGSASDVSLTNGDNTLKVGETGTSSDAGYAEGQTVTVVHEPSESILLEEEL